MRTLPRSLAWAFLFTLPACVVRLTDRNAAEVNGGVTGPAADCSTIQVEPGGIAEGAATEKFVGRFVTLPSETPDAKPVYRFDWSGNFVTIRFQKTPDIDVHLQITTVTVQGTEVAQDQLFQFIVDGTAYKVPISVKKGPDGKPTNIPEDTYPITGLDPNTPHEVTIYKNTEAQKGSVLFKGFDIKQGERLPPVRRARRMEFIGDSITCGYGDEGANATCPFEVKLRDATNQSGEVIKKPNGDPYVITMPVTENQYLAYGSIAARALDADAVTVCWSGKGAYKNYKDRFIRATDGSVIPDPDNAIAVPGLWETRSVGSDGNPDLKWDFSKEPPAEVPDVVVINLGTNDFARDSVPENRDPDKLSGDNIPDKDMEKPEELQRFYEEYLKLVRSVRQHRPQAHIFLTTPPMLTDQFPLNNARSIVRNVLKRIASEVDAKVYQMDLVEQGFRYGLGCDYHPNLEVHRIMADQLIGAVRSKTCW
jgi:lysophospholipase L1-like esterase